jgi:hypothetical protein
VAVTLRDGRLVRFGAPEPPFGADISTMLISKWLA